MNAIPARCWLAAAAVFGLSVTGCGTLRPSVTLTPVRIARVSVDQMPAEIKPLRHGGAALRIDFYSRPELLFEDVTHVMDNVRFCDSGALDELLRGMPSPFFGDTEIRREVPRQKARAALAGGPHAGVRPVYSTYIFIVRPAFPASDQMPARPAYDLMKQPRALCVSLSLYNGYEVARTTNTIAFSADEVAAALGEKATLQR